MKKTNKQSDSTRLKVQSDKERFMEASINQNRTYAVGMIKKLLHDTMQQGREHKTVKKQSYTPVLNSANWLLIKLMHNTQHVYYNCNAVRKVLHLLKMDSPFLNTINEILNFTEKHLEIIINNSSSRFVYKKMIYEMITDTNSRIVERLDSCSTSILHALSLTAYTASYAISEPFSPSTLLTAKYTAQVVDLVIGCFPSQIAREAVFKKIIEYGLSMLEEKREVSAREEFFSVKEGLYYVKHPR